MTTSAALQEKASPIWEKIMVHPFVAGLCRGSLPREKFSFYLLQDYSYLLDSLRNFCLLASRASDELVLRELVGIIALELAGELSAYETYLSRLDLTLDEARRLEPFAAARQIEIFNFGWRPPAPSPRRWGRFCPVTGAIWRLPVVIRPNLRPIPIPSTGIGWGFI